MEQNFHHSPQAHSFSAAASTSQMQLCSVKMALKSPPGKFSQPGPVPKLRARKHRHLPLGLRILSASRSSKFIEHEKITGDTLIKFDASLRFLAAGKEDPYGFLPPGGAAVRAIRTPYLAIDLHLRLPLLNPTMEPYPPAPQASP